MDTEIIKYGLLSLLIVLGGIVVKLYLKKSGLNDMKRILGVNVFWLKLYSNFAIIMGSVALIAFLVALYFDLKLLEII
jgi:hypothetical protein